jgi:hypothetical protein
MGFSTGPSLAVVDDILPSYLFHNAPYTVKLAAVMSAAVLLILAAVCFVPGLRTLLVFAWNCFLQPIGKVSNQGERLDKFYQNQASGECVILSIGETKADSHGS